MPVVPPPVDDEGNITVPDGGTVIPIKEQTNDTVPVQIDISTVPLLFRVRGRIEKILPVDPNDAMGKILILTELDAEQISAAGHHFQLLDTTDPDVPIPVWVGTIKRFV